jgi:hypothetical protein
MLTSEEKLLPYASQVIGLFIFFCVIYVVFEKK